jgi:predicted metal-dependent hydrolase
VERQPEGVRRSARQTLTEAQRLLDDAMPFHAHEVLEDMWKTAPADERSLWRALAQLAVGLTHAARGNTRGAAALLKRAAEGLGPYEGRAPHEVNVDALLRWLGEQDVPTRRPPALYIPLSDI